ncbi:FlgB family protein [Roseobacter sp. YSTF-M11]|uniref:FlgB family protein n=2 Tax=Roseobacter insulae TaxID=2859783 RepID=A0A9X1FST1_9RHOB|nr:FlgB family protein [Roseobacter insulae]
MFKNLEVFKISHAMAVHAGQKQAVAAQNVANSDTPDYKARDLASFADSYSSNMSGRGAPGQLATRSRHLHGAGDGRVAEPMIDESAIASPNGNTVSLEGEMLKSLDAKRQHDRALAIYKSSLGILRTAMRRS